MFKFAKLLTLTHRDPLSNKLFNLSLCPLHKIKDFNPAKWKLFYEFIRKGRLCLLRIKLSANFNRLFVIPIKIEENREIDCLCFVFQLVNAKPTRAAAVLLYRMENIIWIFCHVVMGLKS